MKNIINILLLGCFLVIDFTAIAQVVLSAKYEYFSEKYKYVLSYKRIPYFEQVDDILLRCDEDFEELSLEYNDSTIQLNHVDASNFAKLIGATFLNGKTIYDRKGLEKTSNPPIIDVEIEYGQKTTDKGLLFKDTIYKDRSVTYSSEYLALDSFINEVIAPYLYMVDGAYESYFVQILPEFKNGGAAGLLNYFAKNLRWPQEHATDCTVGLITTKFVVTKKGEIGKIIIIKTPSVAWGAEVSRVLKTIPEGSFSPAYKNNEAVPCWLTYPIRIDPQRWINEVNK